MALHTRRELAFGGEGVASVGAAGALGAGEPPPPPCRAESKLRAYPSAADARAWSHFRSDRSEHVYDAIKRGAETRCRPAPLSPPPAAQLIPTRVLLDTLMAGKSRELARLQRRVAELERLLRAYDLLDLSADQRDRITAAHEAIRSATKEMEELFLDLSSTGAAESDAWGTGKSRGDEWSEAEDESVCSPTTCAALMSGGAGSMDGGGGGAGGRVKGLRVSPRSSRPTSPVIDRQRKIRHEQSTNTEATGDVEILQEEIISKDAKLAAMRNSIEILESDVCEPYCVYAHMYTALEKIFGILKQTPKYRVYIEAYAFDRDRADVDLKVLLLFKLKVLENFCNALTTTCNSQICLGSELSNQIYHARILGTCKTKSSIKHDDDDVCDEARARTKLVADIIDIDEMRQAMCDTSAIAAASDRGRDCDRDRDSTSEYDCDLERSPDSEPVRTEDINLNRLKSMQVYYAEIVTRYENLTTERDKMRTKIEKYGEIDDELENLRSKLKEYSMLWNEKEYYRKKSEESDEFKEKYYTAMETLTNHESRLKAECAINDLHTSNLEKLRCENIVLERLLDERDAKYEIEKSILECKINKMESVDKSKEQQMKSLLYQLDLLAGQQNDEDQQGSSQNDNIIEEMKIQLIRLREIIIAREEDERSLQEAIEKKSNDLDELQKDLRYWKGSYEELMKFNKNIEESQENNISLAINLKQKSLIVKDLNYKLDEKIDHINRLTKNLDHFVEENELLRKKIMELENVVPCSAINNNNTKFSNQSLIFDNEILLDKVDLCDELRTESIELKQSCNVLGNDNILRSKLAIKNAEINKLRNIFEKLFERILFLNEKEVYISSQLGNIIEKKTVLKLNESTSLNSKINEIFESISDFESLKEKYDFISKSYSCMENNNKVLIDKLKEKSEQINKLYYDIKKKDEDNQRIQSDLAKLQNSYDTQIKGLTPDKNNVSLSLELAKKESVQLRKECSSLAANNNFIQSSSKSLKLIILEKDSIIDNLTKKQEHQNMLIQQINKDLIKIKVDYQDAFKEVMNLKADLKNARNEMNFEKVEEQLEEFSKIFKKLNEDNIQLKAEAIKLNKNLYSKLELEKLNNDLETHCEKLEIALIQARTEHTISPQNYLKEEIDQICKDVQTLKAENCKLRKEIGKLQDTVCESENLIFFLSEDLLGRNNKIAMLENYINELEDEIRCLLERLENASTASAERLDLSAATAVTTDAAATAERFEFSAANDALTDADAATERLKIINANKVFTDAERFESSAATHVVTGADAAAKRLDSKAAADFATGFNAAAVKFELGVSTGVVVDSNAPAERFELSSPKDLVIDADAAAERLELIAATDFVTNVIVEQLEISAATKVVSDADADATAVNARRELQALREQHSKDVHHLEIEIKRLKELKESAENELSETKLQFLKEKEDYRLEASKLQHEKEQIISEFKTFEMSLKKDDHIENLGTVERIHASLDKISSTLETQRLKNLCLEQTLFKVQTSSQLLLDKADEAQCLIEKEKLNIIKEKEEAIEEKKKLENILFHQKNDMDETNKRNQQIIKDLQAELINKKILIGNMEKYSSDIENKLNDRIATLKISFEKKIYELSHIQSANDILESLNKNNLIQIDQFTKEICNHAYEIKELKHQINKYLEKQSYTPKKNTVDKKTQTKCNRTRYRSKRTAIEVEENLNFSDFVKLSKNDSKTSLDKNNTSNCLFPDSQYYFKHNDLIEKYMVPERLEIKKYGITEMERQGKSLTDDKKLHMTRINDFPFKENNKTLTSSESDLFKRSYSVSQKKMDFFEIFDEKVDFHRQKLLEETTIHLNPDYIFYKPNECKPIDANNAGYALTEKIINNSQTFFSNHKIRNILKYNKNHDKKLEPHEITILKNQFITPDHFASRQYFRSKTHFYLDDHLDFIKGDSQLSRNNVTIQENTSEMADNKNADITFTTINNYHTEGTEMPKNTIEYYQTKLRTLETAFARAEQDYSARINAIRMQYDTNMKRIINEHNEGINKMQRLHEDNVKEMFALHDNEVESLKASILEANRQAEIFKKEARYLYNHLVEKTCDQDEEPEKSRMTKSALKISSTHKHVEMVRDSKLLSKTNVEAYSVKPKCRCAQAQAAHEPTPQAQVALCKAERDQHAPLPSEVRTLYTTSLSFLTLR